MLPGTLFELSTTGLKDILGGAYVAGIVFIIGVPILIFTGGNSPNPAPKGPNMAVG